VTGRLAFVALVLAASLALPGAAGHARPGATPLIGIVTLATFDLTQRCGGKPGGTAAKKLLVVSCSQTGAFDGRPARAGVSYVWTWNLEVGANGKTTGKGPETGKLGLNFGGGDIVYLTTKGMQLPVGKSTAAKSQAKTTGTWTVTSGGTGRYKSAHGSGTYTYSTTLQGSRFFASAKLTLKGAIS
jgi:hypothetical protein